MILRTRILALAALLAVLFLSLVGYTLAFFSSASAELNRIVRQSLEVEKITETLNSTVLRMGSDIWDTMVFEGDRRAAPIERLDIQARLFYQGLRELSAVDPKFESTAPMRELFQTYYMFGKTILELRSLEDFIGQAPLVEKFRHNQESLSQGLSQLLTASKDQFFGSMDRLNEEFSRTTLVAFALAGVVTLLSLLVAVLMARRLARPLERLTDTVHKVAQGDYSVRPALSSSGEIRDLTETFIVMLNQIEDYSGRMEDLVRARTDALSRTNAILMKDLKLAQKIQAAVIPQRLPTAGALSAAGLYLPMEDLGGDFYDVFETRPGVWTVVMADVSGHGVPAALVTAMVKISLGSQGDLTDPGAVLEAVNRDLYPAVGDVRRYVTMILCRIDLQRGVLDYCNAGHNEFVVVREGRRELFGPNSGIVGLHPDEVFLTGSVPFRAGDSLVLFTDGIVERRSEHTDFGLDRLLALIGEAVDSGPEVLVERVRSELADFSNRPAQDDVALLALRWEPSPLQAAQVPAGLILPFGRTRAEELYRTGEIEALLRWTQEQLSAERPPREASRLWHWRALALVRDRPAEALASWNEALKSDPENSRARRNAALLERHLKEVHP